jgi:hypothetical protein
MEDLKSNAQIDAVALIAAIKTEEEIGNAGMSSSSRKKEGMGYLKREM